jgi:hypothetical protein
LGGFVLRILIPHSAFRIPHSSFRILFSSTYYGRTARILYGARNTPRWRVRIAEDFLIFGLQSAARGLIAEQTKVGKSSLEPFPTLLIHQLCCGAG